MEADGNLHGKGRSELTHKQHEGFVSGSLWAGAQPRHKLDKVDRLAQEIPDPVAVVNEMGLGERLVRDVEGEVDEACCEGFVYAARSERERRKDPQP